MILDWNSGDVSQPGMLSPGFVWTGTATLSIVVVLPPDGIVVDRERLAACTVTDDLQSSSIRGRVTLCSVIEGMD